MNTLNLSSAGVTSQPPLDDEFNIQVESACAQACHAIAPAWPLDRAIAVNPHWSRIDLPVRRVAARMAILGGIHVFPSRDSQSIAFDSGRITTADLATAFEQIPAAEQAGLSLEHCRDAITRPPRLQQLPLLIDALDNDPHRDTRLSWRQAITHQVSQTCAAFFDDHLAEWQPDRHEGLYTFWRETIQHDHGIGQLMGLPKLEQALAALPSSRQDAERWVLQRLGLPVSVWPDYLESVLLTVNGWASWCAYLQWQAKQQGQPDPHLRDLLAIRLAWGAILLESKKTQDTAQAFAAVQTAWGDAPQRLKEAEAELLIDEVWQTALEIGYQRKLTLQLSMTGGAAAKHQDVEVQAAFCIDVRSEPMRRALESVWPAIQTIGFAGFFGLPIAYTPLATQARRPQLPGLLGPTLEVEDHLNDVQPQSPKRSETLHKRASHARQNRLSLSEQWHSASRWPSTAFSFVEAAGLSYLGKLARWYRPSRQERDRDDLTGLPASYRAICRPQLTGLDLDSKVSLAAKVLQGMGLTQDLAPLVLLMGHGSQTANNAHAAALDCGACCGQTGEVNARTLAQLLNDRAVRAGLQALGIDIPDTTHFMATLHNTTTDEIEGFDIDLLPADARKRWSQLQPLFAQAGDQVRRERAATMGLNARTPHKALLTQFRRRANDGAQTRPEWGLAGNAAFILAPRKRTLGTHLQGRVFLHDYDIEQDPDGSLLEQLMTAPMLVTHWINWQYHASTCDPKHLGSGNKLLHNVVGGNIGVFEGNGGDLRIGLSRQSLHNGERWVHEPLRLTVVIDAPTQTIEAVIGKHPVVQNLVDNGWLHLWRFEQDGLMRYERGEWFALMP